MTSRNEWDLLEEVIIGNPAGARFPPCEPAVDATVPAEALGFLHANAGAPVPTDIVDRAQKEIDQVARVLEREGVRVRFGRAVDHGLPFGTPEWWSPGGMHAAMPRDSLLVFGDEIIEAPMAWRCRHYETRAFREILSSYSERGARWTVAPRPTLRDDVYAHDLATERFVVRECEPTFDAADFLRFGDFLVGQRSHVTNSLGIEWLRRHLHGRAALYEIAVNDPKPMHIDATLMPLAEGFLLINPDRVDLVPPCFDGWELHEAPRPAARDPDSDPLYFSSHWLSMNVLSLGGRRVLIEEREEELGHCLQRWGFEPIRCPFRGANALGGSFHCAILDVRRRDSRRG